VVLLSLFTIFLCGMMIVFVGNTDNYKKLYQEQENLSAVAQSELATISNQYDEQVKKTDELKTNYQNQIRDLEMEKDNLAADKQKLERLAQQYQNQAESWKGVMSGFEQSVRNLQASLDQTQQQLDTARSQGIKDQKELNQITSDLYEKIVQLQDLEAERRRLMEQKKVLEGQLASSGTASRPREVTPVTPLNRTARPAASVSNSDIKGLVSVVGESMVQLTVGSADGVKVGTTFHITRGDSFLCDVVVTDVDINKCAGVLELVQQRPQVGDTASTQLY
jgi:chromosome segregation ATPase